MKKITPEELLSHGVHLGHKRTRIHPKSKKFIYAIESGASIIDLFQTSELLEKAESFAERLGEEGKTLLIVGTKKTAKEVVSTLAREHGLLALWNKWVGGFLTNFDAIKKNIATMITMRQEKEEGEWGKLPKHESTALDKHLTRIASVYGGVSEMTKLPDALFIIDIRKEKNAVSEARSLHIPIIAIVDTNTDPDLIDYPIPANDDALTSISFITSRIVLAYVGGRKKNIVEASKVKKETKVLTV